MDSTRRGNYDSGQDYVLEYGELRFTFNERDFSERVEQAALKLGFVAARLEGVELEDLVNLTVNGEVQDPASALGERGHDCWPELVGPAERSLVHWLRRLVFRSAWLDPRRKGGGSDGASPPTPGSTRVQRRASCTSPSTTRPTPSATSSPRATTSRSSSHPSPTGAGWRTRRASRIPPEVQRPPLPPLLPGWSVARCP